MVSLAPPQTAPAPTTLQRRLEAEWALLHELAARNPGRLSHFAAEDLLFRFTLHSTPALALPLAPEFHETAVVSEHQVSLRFPRFFPASPLELYLHRPIFHPNIHPETGFVCLWDRHRVSHNVEHALHKLVAMLGWQLFNRDPVHVMQPAALARLAVPGGTPLPGTFTPAPLLGVVREAGPFVPDRVAAGTAEAGHPPRRRRLL